MSFGIGEDIDRYFEAQENGNSYWEQTLASLQGAEKNITGIWW